MAACVTTQRNTYEASHWLIRLYNTLFTYKNPIMMRAQLRRLARIILIFLRSAIPYFSMSYRLTLSLCLLLTGQQGLAAPYIPRADEVVLERLPVKPNDPAMREIRELRGAIARGHYARTGGIALQAADGEATRRSFAPRAEQLAGAEGAARCARAARSGGRVAPAGVRPAGARLDG